MADLASLRNALEGRYRLERELGAGGMATVYLAQDLKHNRPVAIKVMHPELAAALGAERFLREIEIAARLNHPHILPLLDSGEAGGFLYYVMPFAEGQSLRERLDRGGELPVPEAVRLLRDVADALAYAHGHGVVHRDIKPENILISGTHALVTDFGVAKAVLEATGQQRLTSEGVAVGTPVYMAPEQAIGAPNVDHRADLYALGAVAYELLTGRPPFLGLTAQAVLSAHVAEVPEEVTRLRPAAPTALSQMVMKCLAKRPADRFQSAQELIPQLDALLTPAGGITPTGTQPVAAARRIPRPALVAALVLVVAAGALTVRSLLHRPLDLTTANAVAVTSEPGMEYQPALSPDGNQVAYVTTRGGRRVIAIRSTRAGVGGGEILPAEAVEGEQVVPSWSADGEFVRFARPHPEVLATTPWREVARLGGAARILELPQQTRWAAWSRDGSRAALATGDSLFVYAVADRAVRRLTVHDLFTNPHSMVWSPDDRWIAYVVDNSSWPMSPNTQTSSIWMVEADNGRRVALTAQDHLNVSPAWLDAHHLLFVSNRDGPREVYSLEVGASGRRGEPRKIPGGTDAHSISLSADGTRLAVARLTVRQNVWAYPIGAPRPLQTRDGTAVTSGTQAVETHDVSRDGQWLVYDSNLRGNADIYKVRIDGGAPIPITTAPQDEFSPRWSPDGREVAFHAGESQVFAVSAEGGAVTQLTHGSDFNLGPQWSPDGLHLAYTSVRAGRYGDVWLLTRERVGGPWGEPVQLTQFGCAARAWAFDGSGILCSTRDSTVVLISASGSVLWRRAPAAVGLSGAVPSLSWDGATFYAVAVKGGRRGIWSWPVASGVPRLVVAFDDPSRVPLGTDGALNVGRDRLYVTLAEYESDIWVMDLKR